MSAMTLKEVYEKWKDYNWFLSQKERISGLNIGGNNNAELINDYHLAIKAAVEDIDRGVVYQKQEQVDKGIYRTPMWPEEEKI